MNTDYHDDLTMNVFARNPPGRRSNPPSRWGGDCFAPLLRNSTPFLAERRARQRFGATRKDIKTCLCVRLLSFFSGLNSCNTTALEPEATLDFASTLVDISNTPGVMGNKISIFETQVGPLA